MLFIYKFEDKPFITTEKLFNYLYDLIYCIEYIEVENYNFKLSKIDTHSINTNLYPARYGFICILDNKYNVKLFEPFDVLKEYSISETDFVFEIYKINETIKVFPYPFSFDNYYIQCQLCFDITKEPIIKCKKCNKATCINCNIFKNILCDNCTTNDILL